MSRGGKDLWHVGSVPSQYSQHMRLHSPSHQLLARAHMSHRKGIGGIRYCLRTAWCRELIGESLSLHTPALHPICTKHWLGRVPGRQPASTVLPGSSLASCPRRPYRCMDLGVPTSGQDMAVSQTCHCPEVDGVGHLPQYGQKGRC